ncbi:MAG: hypothetical protein ABSG16_07855 [Candidatus Acidiferrum sp.]
MKHILRFALTAYSVLLIGGVVPEMVCGSPAPMAAAASMAAPDNPASAHDRHGHRTNRAHARRRHHHHHPHS